MSGDQPQCRGSAAMSRHFAAVSAHFAAMSRRFAAKFRGMPQCRQTVRRGLLVLAGCGQARQLLRNAALSDPLDTWHGADRHAAIEGVAEFDSEFAFDAAWFGAMCQGLPYV